MRYVIVFNHPYEGSFCNAILQTTQKALASAGHHVDILHLDDDGFNPVMTSADLKAFTQGTPVDPMVIKYRSILEEADHLILIFPIWWELMPALTKGFIDKVIFPGCAYDYDKTSRWPKMVKRWNRLQAVTMITTMNTPSFAYRLVFGNAIRKAVFTGTFWKIGYRNRKWIRFSMVKFVSVEKRKRWLATLEKHFAKQGPATADGNCPNPHGPDPRPSLQIDRTNPIVSLRSE